MHQNLQISKFEKKYKRCTLATGAEQGLAAPGAAPQHHGPCPAPRVQHPCGTMDTASTQRGWPSGCSAEGPCTCGLTGLPGWHGGSGGVGSSVGGSQPEQTHLPKKKKARRGAPHPGEGSGCLSLPVRDLNFWGLVIKGCSKICRCSDSLWVSSVVVYLLVLILNILFTNCWLITCCYKSINLFNLDLD